MQAKVAIATGLPSICHDLAYPESPLGKEIRDIAQAPRKRPPVSRNLRRLRRILFPAEQKKRPFWGTKT